MKRLTRESLLCHETLDDLLLVRSTSELAALQGLVDDPDDPLLDLLDPHDLLLCPKRIKSSFSLIELWGDKEQVATKKNCWKCGEPEADQAVKTNSGEIIYIHKKRIDCRCCY
jgi:hypothetical protein